VYGCVYVIFSIVFVFDILILLPRPVFMSTLNDINMASLFFLEESSRLFCGTITVSNYSKIAAITRRASAACCLLAERAS